MVNIHYVHGTCPISFLHDKYFRVWMRYFGCLGLFHRIVGLWVLIDVEKGEENKKYTVEIHRLVNKVVLRGKLYLWIFLRIMLLFSWYKPVCIPFYFFLSSEIDLKFYFMYENMSVLFPFLGCSGAVKTRVVHDTKNGHIYLDGPQGNVLTNLNILSHWRCCGPYTAPPQTCAYRTPH